MTAYPDPLRREALLRPLVGDAAASMNAMDVVDLARAGRIGHRDLVRILRSWPYGPRTRRLDPPRMLRAPDSLDAVDTAYFSAGLLSDDEYDEILGAVLA